MLKVVSVVMIMHLLLACSGGSSDISDFEGLEKLGVVGGPTPEDHWQLTVSQDVNTLTLRYHNDGNEDFQWIRFAATDATFSHFAYVTKDEELSNGVFHAGESNTFDIEISDELIYPLWFWATYVTIHEVTVHDCSQLDENGIVTQCDQEPPAPPAPPFSGAYMLSY
jgi:hypothetical protein